MKNPIKKRDFDQTVRPQDDFYRYANGGWLSNNNIPDNENRWGSFQILHHKNTKRLRTLLEENAAKKKHTDSEYKKLADLYNTAMDMKTRNKQCASYIAPALARIEGLADATELTDTIAWLHTIGVGVPWHIWIDQDDKESRRMVLRLAHGGIGVPDRDYYLKKDAESKRLLTAYVDYMTKMIAFENLFPEIGTEKAVKKIIAIEQKLARAGMDKVDCRDTEKIYNKTPLSKLKRTYKNIDWKHYFDVLKVPEKARSHINVDQPKFFAAVDNMIETVPLADWKIYLIWHLFDEYSGTFGKKHLDIRFEYYGKAIQGLLKPPTLWRRAVSVCNGLMPDMVGKMYIKHFFSSAAKKRMIQMTKDILTAFEARIEALTWMSAVTKKESKR